MHTYLTPERINKQLGVSVNLRKSKYHLGLSNSQLEDTISFCDNQKFLKEIEENKNITAVFATEDISNLFLRPDLELIKVADPRYHFFCLLNEIAREQYKKFENEIHPSAKIHKQAFVAENNIKIGSNTIIEPNVTILADVEIGNDCIIRSGSVLGSEGFEFKRTSKGILPVFHDGKVIIRNNVEIGACTCIDKGFSFRDTIINDSVKIDNLVHIAHGVHIGENSFIIACSMIAGSVNIGKNVWISPNSNIAPGLTIGDGAFVSLASVVTKNVSEGQQVTGNFAIPHEKFIKNFKKSLID